MPIAGGHEKPSISRNKKVSGEWRRTEPVPLLELRKMAGSHAVPSEIESFQRSD